MRNWRAVVLASVGDGSTRRQASDAIKLFLALLVVLVTWLFIRANTLPEVDIEKFLNPPPYGVRWIVSAVWIIAFVMVVVVVGVLAIVSRNIPMIRDVVVVTVLSWLTCVAAGWLLGSTAGRPSGDVASNVSPGFPSVRIAVAAGIYVVAHPYLSRPIRRLLLTMVVLLGVSAAVHGAAFPLTIVASIALGFAAAYGTKLIFGRPRGIPSLRDVRDALDDFGLVASNVAPKLSQSWGVVSYGAQDADGRRLDISVYGRDASDAQLLTKAWRGLWYRDSGPTLALSRLQQIEHEAYLMMRATALGVQAGSVVTLGYGGPNRDALLVTTPAPGGPIGDMDASQLSDEALDNTLRTMLELREGRIAHGAISVETIFVDEGSSVGVSDFRLGSSIAPDERLDIDLANALVALALVAGNERVAQSAKRVVGPDVLNGAMLNLQPSGLSVVNDRLTRSQKGFVATLRADIAGALGVPEPELAKLQRVSWSKALLWIGTVIGMWALVGVFINVASSFDTLKGAAWGWVAVVFVIALFPPLVLAWSLVSSIFEGVPLLQATMLQESQTFTGMIGSAIASMAVMIRFFQRRGRDIAYATTTSVMASAASWTVKGILFVIAVPLAWGNFHFDFSTSSHQGLVNVIIIVVVAAVVLVGLILALPKLRHLAWGKIKPQLVKAVQPLKNLMAEPRRLAVLLLGNAGAQLLTVFALGASLHAFGYHLSVASLIVIITVASMLGGVSPVPGGIGIVEAGLIAGFVAAGIPQDVAAATVFVQRLFTAYLPPLWGWLALVWLERKELI